MSHLTNNYKRMSQQKTYPERNLHVGADRVRVVREEVQHRTKGH